MRWPFGLVIVVVALLVPRALAWNKAGHMVSAAIAYAQLKQDSPATIAKTISLLKEHPQYESHWLNRINAIPSLTDEEKDMYLFMQAARWADDIRSDDDYHHSRWHYINLPIKPPGQPNSVQPPPPDPDNILRAYEVNLGKMKDKKLSATDRAVAASWVFHLIGDGHQPLHAVSLYTTAYPQGDKGGNKFYINAKAGASAIPLHQYWDDLIIGTDRFQSVRNRATELRLRPDFTRSKLPELREANFEKWVSAESFKLARDVVYLNGQLKGGTDQPTAVVLPESYAKTAKDTAERRIVLAGYRLADVLKKSMEK